MKCVGALGAYESILVVLCSYMVSIGMVCVLQVKEEYIVWHESLQIVCIDDTDEFKKHSYYQNWNV